MRSSFLILTAMPRELKPLCAALKNVKKIDAAFYQAETVSGKQLLLAASGLGALLAACRVTELACQYKLQGAVLLGVGGGLQEELAAGVTVVADRILQHDSYAVMDEGKFFMQPGCSVTTVEASNKHEPCFLPDKNLRELCLTALTKTPHRSGTIVCGGEFSGTYLRKKELAALAEDILLVEMEAGGFALAAQRMNIPFAVSKGIADRLLAPEADTAIIDDFHKGFDLAMEGSLSIARYIQDNL